MTAASRIESDRVRLSASGPINVGGVYAVSGNTAVVAVHTSHVTFTGSVLSVGALTIGGDGVGGAGFADFQVAGTITTPSLTFNQAR